MKQSDYRAREGLSIAEFARRIGVSRAAAGRYERGTRKPEWEVVARIKSETSGAVTFEDYATQGGDRTVLIPCEHCGEQREHAAGSNEARGLFRAWCNDKDCEDLAVLASE